jgi:hypothetical protein
MNLNGATIGFGDIQLGDRTGLVAGAADPTGALVVTNTAGGAGTISAANLALGSDTASGLITVGDPNAGGAGLAVVHLSGDVTASEEQGGATVHHVSAIDVEKNGSMAVDGKVAMDAGGNFEPSDYKINVSLGSLTVGGAGGLVFDSQEVNAANHSGFITVDGNGAKLTTTKFEIGLEHAATVDASGGATVQTTGNVDIAQPSGATTITVESGATWTTTGDLNLNVSDSYSGAVNMVVKGGGSSLTTTGKLYFGTDPATLLLDDSGAVDAQGGWLLGNGSNEAATIQGGATLKAANATIDDGGSKNVTVTVTGANSKLNISKHIAATETAPAREVPGDLVIGKSGAVADTDATSSSAIDVTVSVLGGAAISSGTGEIDPDKAAKATVLVSGAGSNWTMSDRLTFNQFAVSTTPLPVRPNSPLVIPDGTGISTTLSIGPGGTVSANDARLGAGEVTINGDATHAAQLITTATGAGDHDILLGVNQYLVLGPNANVTAAGDVWKPVDGFIKGNGKVISQSHVITAAGKYGDFVPGGTEDAPYGTLTLGDSSYAANLDATAGVTLQIIVGTDGVDSNGNPNLTNSQLAVNGAVALPADGGTGSGEAELVVNYNGTVPSDGLVIPVGTLFPILTGSSISGQFYSLANNAIYTWDSNAVNAVYVPALPTDDQPELPKLAAGLGWRVKYNDVVGGTTGNPIYGVTLTVVGIYKKATATSVDVGATYLDGNSVTHAPLGGLPLEILLTIVDPSGSGAAARWNAQPLDLVWGGYGEDVEIWSIVQTNTEPDGGSLEVWTDTSGASPVIRGELFTGNSGQAFWQDFTVNPSASDLGGRLLADGDARIYEAWVADTYKAMEYGVAQGAITGAWSSTGTGRSITMAQNADGSWRLMDWASSRFYVGAAAATPPTAMAGWSYDSNSPVPDALYPIVDWTSDWGTQWTADGTTPLDSAENIGTDGSFNISDNLDDPDNLVGAAWLFSGGYSINAGATIRFNPAGDFVDTGLTINPGTVYTLLQTNGGDITGEFANLPDGFFTWSSATATNTGATLLTDASVLPQLADNAEWEVSYGGGALTLQVVDATYSATLDSSTISGTWTAGAPGTIGPGDPTTLHGINIYYDAAHSENWAGGTVLSAAGDIVIVNYESTINLIPNGTVPTGGYALTPGTVWTILQSSGALGFSYSSFGNSFSNLPAGLYTWGSSAAAATGATLLTDSSLLPQLTGNLVWKVEYTSNALTMTVVGPPNGFAWTYNLNFAAIGNITISWDDSISSWTSGDFSSTDLSTTAYVSISAPGGNSSIYLPGSADVSGCSAQLQDAVASVNSEYGSFLYLVISGTTGTPSTPGGFESPGYGVLQLLGASNFYEYATGYAPGAFDGVTFTAV